MTPRRWAATGLLTFALAATSAGTAAAAPASADPAPAGTGSLASVLLADGNRFDTNWYDYDIVTEAVLAVLANDSQSPVKVLTDGTVPLTAFIPNDRAFQVLVADLTGKWMTKESDVFAAVAGLGIGTVESVLRYHVVPGATIDSRAALGADGAKLTTALEGKTITVDVLSQRLKLIRLIDRDRDDIDPFVNSKALDINKGNRQIAHGITFVLRPVNL